MMRAGGGLGGSVVLGVGLLLAAGCASAGRAFPTSTEPSPHAVGRAMAAIADAATAGADSLAPEPLKMARQHLTEASSEEQAKHTDRAGLLAREAIAEATLAHAEADRINAERARAAAGQQLQQVTSESAAATGVHP
jgi:Domain of unknown function (DUF4398)